MSTRKCDEALARIYPYLDGEMTWFRRRKIMRHLKSCDPCEDTFSFESRLKRVVRDANQDEPPEDLVAKLQQMLRKTDAEDA